jgi:hypothetical protein
VATAAALGVFGRRSLSRLLLKNGDCSAMVSPLKSGV